MWKGVYTGDTEPIQPLLNNSWKNYLAPTSFIFFLSNLEHTYLSIFYLWAVAHVLFSNLLRSFSRYFSWVKLIVSFQKFTYLHFIRSHLYLQ